MKKYNPMIIALLFLFVYEPPILNVNILHIIGVISIAYIILNYTYMKENILGFKITSLYIIFAFLFFYVFVITVLNNNPLTSSLIFIYWLVDVIPACIMFAIYFKKNKFLLTDVVNILFIAGTIESITAILAFFQPSIKMYFVGRMISYGYMDVINELSAFRIYGFSSNLAFSMPIVQSVFLCLSLYLAVNKNIKYLAFAPAFIFSAVINARITFVIIGIGIVSIILVSQRIAIKRLTVVIIIIIFFVQIGGIYQGSLENGSNETYKWIVSGFKEIVSFLTGNKLDQSYFNYVSDINQYTLPNAMGFVVGNGTRILSSNKYGVYSDIGYINDIWLGGVLYCILIYTTFANMLKQIYWSKCDEVGLNRMISLLFSGVFLLGNVKGYIIGMNNFTNLFFILYFYAAVLKNHSIESIQLR